ncbi:MAG: hypothetical protein CVT88_02925 [Candidatus Altiarchaeales archaeon HGW-Altiarchaeales-1]|nr:MAG: hypothetical protein CVT88_02925 [Candidatus Altiarchaeales archaeon HGW-Altiarchaeales-1]
MSRKAICFAAKDRILKCPNCGKEVEIWSDEFKAKCPNCKKEVFKEEASLCIEWCKHAKECVGEERYEEYEKNKKFPKNFARV